VGSDRQPLENLAYRRAPRPIEGQPTWLTHPSWFCQKSVGWGMSRHQRRIDTFLTPPLRAGHGRETLIRDEIAHITARLKALQIAMRTRPTPFRVRRVCQGGELSISEAIGPVSTLGGGGRVCHKALKGTGAAS